MQLKSDFVKESVTIGQKVTNEHKLEDSYRRMKYLAFLLLREGFR